MVNKIRRNLYTEHIAYSQEMGDLKKDIYNVSSYTDDELYEILDLSDPTDGELEAKLISTINKYEELEQKDLVRFFIDVYKHFFKTEENTENENQPSAPAPSPAPAPAPSPAPATAPTSDTGYTRGSAVGVPEIKLVTHTRSKLNPLLKEEISRTISINSLFRQDPKNTISTSFIINLAEPLNNVIEIRLSSYQIPFTWYTINNNYGGNFFYIKGNAEGIDNGNHDYKITIAPGNYTESGIINTINTELAKLSAIYTDVNFGQTEISYNNSTIKSTFNIDITKLFNQSNYYLEFPYDPFETLPGNKQNLGKYLGFEQKKYETISSILSRADLSLIDNSPNSEDNTFPNYSIDDTNYRFQIIQYTGTDTYHETSTIIETIPVDLTKTLGKVSRNAVVDNLTAVLANHPKLDHAYSSIERINITDPNFENEGSSYFKLRIKLNRYTTKNIIHSKIVVVFPDEDPNKVNKDYCIWVGNNTSCFHFEYLENETNLIISETAMVQSSYVVSGTMEIQLKCNSYPFDVSYNDYLIRVANSNEIGYTYRNYIDKINEAIKLANTTYSLSTSTAGDLNLPSTNMDTDANSYLNLTVDLTRRFTNKYYTVNIAHRYLGTFNDSELSDTTANTFTNTFISGTYILDYDTDVITVTPQKDTYSFVSDTEAATIELTIELLLTEDDGNLQVQVKDHVHYKRYFKMLELGYDVEYITSLMKDEGRNPDYLDTPTQLIQKIRTYKTYVGFSALEKDINKLFNNYKDYLGDRPFSNSSVVFTYLQGNQIQSTLTFNVNKTLTQLNYGVIFYDSETSQATPNRWVDKLHFKASYNMSKLVLSGSTTVIRNDQIISDNLITIEKDINDYFTFKPYTNIDGLNTDSGKYDVKIVIPPGIYDRNSLYSKINNAFGQNPISVNSSVGSYEENDIEYTAFTVNIYKAFTTKDYRLVFYDPLSFAQCNSSGANKTIQNAKWDSTIGWILGFRAQPVYYLDEYVSSATDNIYYDTTNSNKCVLVGDTCVSVSLFNYFMIIFDDFNQNHLNDGLITTSPQEQNADLGLNNTYTCDPITNQKVISAAGNTIGKTANQIYAAQQKYLAKQVKARPYSTAASIKDVFAIIPITTGKFTVGQVISENSGTLQTQSRIYFGPVNLRRVSVKLVNERGDLLDLNNQNWSFTIEATILQERAKPTSTNTDTNAETKS